MRASVEEKIADFWYGPSITQGASEEELKEAERRIGFRLPAELRVLLGTSDGGVTRYDMFDEIVLSPFLGVTERSRATGNLVDFFARQASKSAREVVVFAADADAWFGLDYRARSEEPAVIHWSEYEEEPILLRSRFRDFIDHLRAGGVDKVVD